MQLWARVSLALVTCLAAVETGDEGGTCLVWQELTVLSSMYGLQQLSSPCPLPPAVSAGVALSEVPRDQGFTRPKALLLLPIRSSAHKVVSRLVQLALGTDKGAVVHNRDRWAQQGCGAVRRLQHHLVLPLALCDADPMCC